MSNFYSFIRGRVIPVLLVIGALIIFGISVILPLKKVYSAKKWVKTECFMTESFVEKTYGGKEKVNHNPKFKYKYKYKGKKFIGSDYNFQKYEGIERAQKLVAKFPVSSNQMCYVNPENPKVAVLSINLDKRQFISALLFIIVMLILALILFFGYEKNDSQMSE
ncbi:DUF3592 domain-containing protein [Lentisphaerota bacterium WC36G]|nr:DUF3592 domain-containing protein [Lentisphaerae bacterium WC36]